MTEKVNVVVLPEAIEEAYKMGFKRFEGIDLTEKERGDFDISPFHGSAAYANHVLPNLRSMSGFNDHGHGTYTDSCRVVTVEYPDDRPMSGELTDSDYIFNELVDSWHNGVYDAIEGNDFGNYLEF